METLAIIFIALNLALMGLVSYLLITRKEVNKDAVDAAAVKAVAAVSIPRPMTHSDYQIIAELKEEITNVKVVASRLERKNIDLDIKERQFDEKLKRLDILLRSADDAAHRMERHRPAQRDEETYVRALNMIKTGVPPEEVGKGLGLLNGEVELLSGISDI